MLLIDELNKDIVNVFSGNVGKITDLEFGFDDDNGVFNIGEDQYEYETLNDWSEWLIGKDIKVDDCKFIEDDGYRGVGVYDILVTYNDELYVIDIVSDGSVSKLTKKD